MTGKTADVTGEEKDGILTNRPSKSRGELCATGNRVAAGGPRRRFPFRISPQTAAGRRAPAGRRDVLSARQMARPSVPRVWAGDAATEYLADVREN